MAIRIDWNKLMKTQEGERTVFEQFCRHMILRRFKGCGIEEPYYNTPGSETYILLTKSIEYEGIKLEAGDVIGWQAKDWRGKDPNNSPLTAKHKEELENGFKAAVGFKGDKLKLWILCTPGDFDQKAYSSLESRLLEIKSDCTIVRWSKGKFEGFYINERDTYNGIFQYYFDGHFLGRRELDRVTEDTLTYQEKKYDVTLHIAPPQEEELLSIVDKESARKLLGRQAKAIKKAVDYYKKQYGFKIQTIDKEKVSRKLSTLCAKEMRLRYSFAATLTKLVEDEQIVDHIEDVTNLLDQYKTKRKELVKTINEEIKNEREKAKARNDWHRENAISRHIGRVYELESLIAVENEGGTNLVDVVAHITERVHSIFAEPGYGKTHLACSLADKVLHGKKSLPVLLLSGTEFSLTNSVDRILAEKLHLSDKPTLDDIMDVLDFTGESYGCRLPIIIDGLNESEPNIGRWKRDIPLLAKRVHERKHLMLITTCRSQEDYLQEIYDCDTIHDKNIENPIELNGISRFDVLVAAERYFNKYKIEPNRYQNLSQFTNPLLLRIFSEVNAGKKHIDIHGTSLTESMKEYSDTMVKDVVGKGIGTRGVVYELNQKLDELAQKVWNEKLRQFDYYEVFVRQFGSELADKLIDKTACFSLDRKDRKLLVRYSYDMIAGYYIARSIIHAHAGKDDFINYITANKEKLFEVSEYGIANDVIKSLLCLIPKEFDEHWCTLMPIDEVTTASIDNIDVLLYDQKGIETLQQLIARSRTKSQVEQKLCERLYKRIAKEGNLSKFHEFMPLFYGMKPIEIDEYWNHNVLEYADYENLAGLFNDNYWLEGFEWEDIINCQIMLCGLIDREYRQGFIKLLFTNVLKGNRVVSLRELERGLQIKDVYILESIVAVLIGLSMRTDVQSDADAIIKILERYMQTYKSNSVFLLDALDTLYNYSESRWGVKYNRTILGKNKGEVWEKIDEEDIRMFGVFDLDDDKYLIQPLYQNSYKKIMKKLYDRDDVYGMLWARCQTRGYNEEICRRLDTEAYNRAKYRMNYQDQYGFKYGRYALSELYGWLIINNQLMPEFKDSYRLTFIDIDPSMPQLPERWNLVHTSYMPENVYKLAEWLQQDNRADMKELFVRSLPNQTGEWVMLFGRIHQNVEIKYADYYVRCVADLHAQKATKKHICETDLADHGSMNHVYAGEIGWRMFKSREPEYDSEEHRRILSKYEFTGWDSTRRISYPELVCFKTELANELGLRFDVNSMAYYDKEGRVASAYYVNDTDQFFYVRKDVVDALLTKKKACLRLHICENRIVNYELPKALDTLSTKASDKVANLIYRLKLDGKTVDITYHVETEDNRDKRLGVRRKKRQPKKDGSK